MRNRKKKWNYRELFSRSAICTAGALLAYIIGLLLITLIVYKGIISEAAGVHSIPLWCALCVFAGCFTSIRSGKSIMLSTIPMGLFLFSFFLVGSFFGELDWAGEGRLIPIFCIAAAGMAGTISIWRDMRRFKRRTTRL